MPYYSPGPEMSATYVLTSPRGTRAVFNDATDPDFVGMLTDFSGFDSPEVREESENTPQGDGGKTGITYFGRRPVTLTALVLNPASTVERGVRLAKVRRAVAECMRADGTLTWTTAAGQSMFLSVRNQQPLRITGGWQKSALVALVASDPRIYGVTLRAANFTAAAPSDFGFGFPLTFPLSFGGGYTAGQLLVNNDGDAAVYPVYTIVGPATNPTILNYTTGEKIVITAAIGAGESWTIDVANRLVTTSGVNMYSTVDPLSTTWFALQAGATDLRFLFTDSSVSTTVNVQWRDAWI